MASNLDTVMTRDEAIEVFDNHILPLVIHSYEQDGHVDEPARCEAWMADGTQVAIARSNDRFICGHFDARENPLSPAAVFEGGSAESKALTWLKRMKTICA